MHARLRGPNNLLFLHQIINKPDMNIKVAAFTISEKFINTLNFFLEVIRKKYFKNQ